jgi:glycerophosphoryl diester phosphodiesterase
VPSGVKDLLRARTFLTVAHRGASAYAPENTMEAFELALSQGVEALELDVHLTRDDEVAVIHDDTLDRTTSGRGPVRERTLRELQELDAGVWFGARWRGVRVPSLTEVLRAFGPRAWLDIEIKGGVRAHWFLGAVAEDATASVPLARRTIEEVAAAGALDRVVISSFGLEALRWVRRAHPDVATQVSVLSREVGAECRVAADAGIDVLSPQVYAATPANVDAAHQAGLAVHIYAADGDDALAGLIDLGVDGIKTNRPDRLRALLAARRGAS